MNKDEALDKALDALIHKANMIPVMQGNCYVIHPEAMQAVIDEAIKQARSAPVQEPVAFFDWYDNAHWGNEDLKECCHRSWNAAIKYTTLPAAQRQWVGLTEQERNDIEDYCEMIVGKPAFDAIEAKLKEKNT
jgi:hypothetical protein